LAVFTEIRLIKKEEKHAQSITAFRTGIRRTGGCNNTKDNVYGAVIMT